MLENSLVGRIIVIAGLAGSFVLATPVGQPNHADSETHVPFIAGSGEEFLDKIFKEEKSDRICRFVKIKKMKA